VVPGTANIVIPCSHRRVDGCRDISCGHSSHPLVGDRACCDLHDSIAPYRPHNRVRIHDRSNLGDTREQQAKSRWDLQEVTTLLCGSLQLLPRDEHAQKTMGIIVPLLFSIGYYGASADLNHLQVPIWVILLAQSALAIGTLTGGWRIVRTMGYGITKLRPVHGFAAETASAATIIGASVMGIPVSTTQVICAR